MENFNSFVWTVITISVFVGLAYAVRDQYWLRRERMIEAWKRRDEAPKAQSAPEPAIDAAGELTTAAKYALWQYMLNILAVGGTVIGIIAGIAGYMIKDLASAGAIQTALNKMQEPLARQLDKISTADASLKLAIEKTKNDEAFAQNVGNVIKGEVQKYLLENVARELVNKDLDKLRPDVAVVSDDLVKRYKDQLRGKPGVDAVPPPATAVAEELFKKHRDELRGENGKSPDVEAVAAELATKYPDKLRGKPGADAAVAAVAEELFKKHRDELRGENGKSPGVEAVAAELVAKYPDKLRGKPGADAVSPSVTAVAEELFRKHEAQLRPDVKSVSDDLVARYPDRLRGPEGKRGDNAVAPPVAVIVKELVDKHRDELRGAPGEKGKDGPDAASVAAALVASHLDTIRGPKGDNGVSPDPVQIAELLAARYADQLRGPPGKNGTNGINGESPKAADVAASIWENHRDELRQRPRPRPPARQRSRQRTRRGG
jgi:hypothetical protein